MVNVKGQDSPDFTGRSESTSQEELELESRDKESKNESVTAASPFSPQSGSSVDKEEEPALRDSNATAKDGVDSWKKKKKHILVLSNAGKPIYSRYGDENTLSSLFSLLQAIVSRTQDKIEVVSAGVKKFVFLVKDPVYLVCIHETPEPTAYIQKQLNLLYNHILFHITKSALESLFQRKPNFDLRSLWGGPNIEGELNGLIKLAHYSPTILLGAVPVLMLPLQARNLVHSALKGVKQSNLIFAILIAKGKVVGHVSPKGYPIEAQDILLLINFIEKATQLRSHETWTPLCLPSFNSTGFLHAYTAYVSKDVCLMLLSSGESLDQFHYCSSSKNAIVKQLRTNKLLEKIQRALSEPVITPQLCNAAAAIHLIHRNRTTGEYFETEVSDHAPLFRMERKRLVRRYAEIIHKVESGIRFNADSQLERSISKFDPKIISPSVASRTDSGSSSRLSLASGSGSKKWENELVHVAWDVNITEAVLSLSSKEFEVHAMFHPSATIIQARACLNRFIEWEQKNHEDLYLVKRKHW